MSKRVILIVLDSVGIGELPDAGEFGDVGSHTLGHIAETVADFSLPNLQSLGLGNIVPMGLEPVAAPRGAFGRAAEKSRGKDTITGHWEIAGLVPDITFPYFPEGFPPSIMEPFHKAIGTRTIGNYPASGTAIIEELGDEHVRTGYPIVYTSSDSVFQIAMHEEVIPLERQYEICRIAREQLVGENAVGRVIARPFVGTSGQYTRTANRRDFSLEPPGRTVLDCITAAGLEVRGVGKIKDIFAGVGISDNLKTKNNPDGIDKTIQLIGEDFSGLIFTNLVDFDTLYGHRRDPQGYADCLREFDAQLPRILDAMGRDDVLILTADHGNDPTYKGTDHTREYVPVLVYGHRIQPGVDLGTRSGFSDIGASIADLLGVAAPPFGESFRPLIQRQEVAP